MPSTDSPPPPPLAPTLEPLLRFALIMALLLAAAAFPQSALFVVERIEVTGAGRLPEDAVVRLAGLRLGHRLFAVDASGAQQRLRADPRIKEAAVQVRPPRTVVLRVVERRPVLALVLGEQVALLGDDLVVVAVAGRGEGVPEVVDRIGRIPWARPGAPVASEAARIALAVLPEIPAPLREDLRRVEVGPGADLVLTLQSGLEIRAGAPAGVGARLAQVPQVLEALRARGVRAEALDLRYAGSIAVRLSGGGAVTPTGGEGR